MNFSILHNLNMPVMVVTGAGKVRHGNPSAGVFWGISEQRLSEFPLTYLFGMESELPGWVSRTIAQDSSMVVEGFRFQKPREEHETVLRVQIDPIYEGGIAKNEALLMFWDRGKQEALESELLDQQVSERVTGMVRQLAHEMRNPMSGVKGAIQLLARQLKQQPEFAEYPVVILREMERLERLMKHLLAYGESPPLNLSHFNLHELMDEMLWFEKNAGAQVTFIREYDPSLPDIEADRDRIHQVLLNLIRNAVQASPPGGKVWLRTAFSGPWSKEVASKNVRHTHFQIDVVDQGQGVPKDLMPRLFTPLFTTKTDGNGLGLSICMQIVRAHQGTLKYQRQNNTSQFRVLIPFGERV